MLYPRSPHPADGMYHESRHRTGNAAGPEVTTGGHRQPARCLRRAALRCGWKQSRGFSYDGQGSGYYKYKRRMFH